MKHERNSQKNNLIKSRIVIRENMDDDVKKKKYDGSNQRKDPWGGKKNTNRFRYAPEGHFVLVRKEKVTVRSE